MAFAPVHEERWSPFAEAQEEEGRRRSNATPTPPSPRPGAEQSTVDEVREIYLAAWGARVKGITVYRYGSLPTQVLTFLSDVPEGPPVEVGAEYAGGCRVCDT